MSAEPIREIVTLRPVDFDADRELLERIYASVRAAELEQVPWSDEEKAAFCSQQFVAQDTHYRTHFSTAAFDLVLVDGESAGRLYVGRYEREIRVIDISLLPEFRGKGIGARLLGELQSEAAEKGVAVTIHVEHQNPARRLYDRLGFRAVDDDGVYLTMSWKGDTG